MQSLLTIILSTISISFGIPLGGIENVFSVTSQGLGNLGQQFFQWSEQKKQKVVPHYGSYGRESAVLETEGLLSKLDSKYTRSHNFIADIIGHKPLIDSIQEYEKYGNDGEKARNIGKSIIAGFDGVANVANAVLDAPSDKARYASRKTTSVLNVIGASLIGL